MSIWVLEVLHQGLDHEGVSHLQNHIEGLAEETIEDLRLVVVDQTFQELVFTLPVLVLIP